MYKRFILPLLLAVLLVACGQGEQIDMEENINHPETSEIENNEQDGDNNDVTDSSTTDQDNATAENSQADEGKSSGNLPELNVHFIDVGQADATLFQFGEHHILFDIGDWRGNEVVNYLKAKGVESLDLVIGSHPDADHIGQLADVMNNFPVSEVWLSGNMSTSKTFQRGLEAVLNSDANYHEPRAGEEFEIGPMTLSVLHPKTITGASNEESISVLFTYGNVKFVFTGDADKHAEKQMMGLGINIDADILHLGHHGSSTSNDPTFIQAVSPDIAIYSAGANNSYGHPHHEVVSYIQNAGITLYGTDVHGTIIVTTDGNEYSIKTNKDGTITPKNTSSGQNTNTNSGTTSSNSSQQEKNNNSSCININTASYEEVQNIIHIGPERAKDLINLRPYRSVKDLDRIKGIGPARLKDIEAQGLACVE